MILANLKPNFLTIWNSLDKSKKTQLKIEFSSMSGNIGHMTFFRKKKECDYTELEKNWWAEKLNAPKEQLFPNN